MNSSLKMNKSLSIFYLIILSTMVPLALAAAEEPREITWFRADFPPVTIPFGEQVNTGFFDKTMKILIEQLPDYTHNFQVANFKRIMMEIESNRNVCCPSLYKTKERERFVTFSVPAMIVLPNGIISSEQNRKKFTPHLDAEGKISLSSLLADNSVTIGISNGRKYSGGIDEILQEFQNSGSILVQSGNDVFRGLMKMMHLGRIDGLIGYPVEAGFFTRKDKELNDFVYYPIKESSVLYTVGYIGCPDTDWGKTVIERVNKIVLEHRDKEFINFYGEWLDEATRIVHKQIAREYFQSLE